MVLVGDHSLSNAARKVTTMKKKLTTISVDDARGRGLLGGGSILRTTQAFEHRSLGTIPAGVLVTQHKGPAFGMGQGKVAVHLPLINFETTSEDGVQCAFFVVLPQEVLEEAQDEDLDDPNICYAALLCLVEPRKGGGTSPRVGG